MSKKQKKACVLIPTPEEDQAINTAALSDPDAQPLTDEQLQAMVPLRLLSGRLKSPEKAGGLYQI